MGCNAKVEHKHGFDIKSTDSENHTVAVCFRRYKRLCIFYNFQLTKRLLINYTNKLLLNH